MVWKANAIFCSVFALKPSYLCGYRYFHKTNMLCWHIYVNKSVFASTMQISIVLYPYCGNQYESILRNGSFIHDTYISYAAQFR